MLGGQEKNLANREPLGESLTSFSSVLPTSQVLCCAGKPIKRAVSPFLKHNYAKRLTQRKIYWNFVVKLLIRSKIMKWRGTPITATERMKAQTQRRTQNPQIIATKTFCGLKGKEKATAIRGRKCISVFKSTLTGKCRIDGRNQTQSRK